jgi:hypothetical protein
MISAHRQQLTSQFDRAEQDVLLAALDLVDRLDERCVGELGGALQVERAGEATGNLG